MPERPGSITHMEISTMSSITQPRVDPFLSRGQQQQSTSATTYNDLSSPYMGYSAGQVPSSLAINPQADPWMTMGTGQHLGFTFKPGPAVTSTVNYVPGMPDPSTASAVAGTMSWGTSGAMS